ncbi:MAG: hypothetical protein JNL21_04415 [Myxococcales bacterium]|nr:hypothetical protein [Myxococcales bacterium]
MRVLGSIRRAAGLAELRMRLSRSLRVAPLSVTIALALAAVTLAAHKLAPERLPEPRAWLVFAGIGGLLVVVHAVAFLLKLPPNAGTLALDRHHGHHGRLTNAIEFSAVPKAERTELMQAAIDEACSFVAARPRRATLATSRAAPIVVPLEVGAALAPAVVLVALALLELPRAVPVTTTEAKTIDPLVLSEDDLDLFREAAKELERPDQSPEVKQALERFNRLIEDMADRRLDRTEAFRQMESIERELLDGAEADAKKLEAELKETAKQLEKSELSKEIADALKDQDLKRAEQKTKELAEKLKTTKKPDKKQLEKLREALKKASEQRKQALEAINERRKELEEQLLKKKKDLEKETNPQKKEEEERLLKKKERELERLDREAAEQQRANRELERLDRELAEAAQNLLKEAGITQEDLQKAAQDLQQAAEDINRMEREGMSQKDKEQLKQKLEELRERLRQEQKAGKKGRARLENFSKRARGGKGKQGKGKQGEGGDEQGEGQGKSGDKMDREGQGQDGEGEGEEGEDGQQGKGKGKGKGQGEGEGEGEEGLEISFGPGGNIPIPGAGQGQGEGQSGQGDQPGEGSGKGDKGPGGVGSGGDPRGAATDGAGMDTMDVEAAANDSGQGAIAKQVIRSAADRGFRGSKYKQVYKEAKTKAEEDMKTETIPDGYRFYVQRYFQLIRPRD